MTQRRLDRPDTMDNSRLEATVAKGDDCSFCRKEEPS
jgi:hypothetical protein